MKMTFVNGKFFPRAARGAGGFFILISLLILLFNYAISITLLAVGTLIATTDYGVDLRCCNLEYREFVRVFWIKLGKWKRNSEIKYISILRIREGETAYLQGAALPVSTLDEYFDIYFLNEQHRKELMVARYFTYQDAERGINDIASKYSMKIVQYSPPVSRKSRFK